MPGKLAAVLAKQVDADKLREAQAARFVGHIRGVFGTGV
jgi:hypothetical protein